MCGIIYLERKDGNPAAKATLKRYHKQKERGREGYGFVGFTGNARNGYERTQTEREIETKLKAETAPIILFHHRLPTSTPNLAEAAHPLFIRGKKHSYYIAHNGVIHNAQELRQRHEKDGWKYKTDVRKETLYIIGKKRYTETTLYQFNDSEAFAIELVRYLEGEVKTLSDVRGSIAFVALETDKTGKKILALHYGRNAGNPLTIESGKDIFALRSQGGTSIPIHYIYSRDIKTGTETRRDVVIGANAYDYGWSDTKQKTIGFDTERKETALVPYSDTLDDFAPNYALGFSFLDLDYREWEAYGLYTEADYIIALKNERDYCAEEYEDAILESDSEEETQWLGRMCEIDAHLDDILKNGNKEPRYA